MMHAKAQENGALAPLLAVPVASSHVRAEAQSDHSGLVLRLVMPARGGLATLLENWLGFSRSRSFELDEVGASFWNAIDGARSLLEIQRSIARQFALDEARSRRAVIEFTTILMRRNLISLRIEPEERPG